MGIYTRPDSPYYWLWLETTQRKERTDILIGKTAAQRHDSRQLVEDRYHQRMNELAARVYRLPSARPKMPTFATFAAWYDAHVIEHRKGREREREILKRLVRDFGTRAIDAIDRELVATWRTTRLKTPTVIEHFGGRPSHVPVWARVHALLKARGPLKLADIRTTLKLTVPPRQVARTYLTPRTMKHFRRVRPGVWAAVGSPPLRLSRTLPPPKARTVNREVDLLQQILAAAVPKYLDTSPLAGLPNLPVSQPLRRTMTVAEEQRLLETLAVDDRAILLTGLDTLARLGDILDLKRSDDHGQLLDIRDPKNGLAHTVPISTRLRVALDAVPIDPRQPQWYFPRRRRAVSERDRRHTIAQALRRACGRAGLPYGRTVNGITFHWSTRRTGATRMIRAGGERAIATTQQIGNWKDPRVLIEIYQETTTAEMRAAVETVAQATDPPPAPVRFPVEAKVDRGAKQKRA